MAGKGSQIKRSHGARVTLGFCQGGRSSWRRVAVALPYSKGLPVPEVDWGASLFLSSRELQLSWGYDDIQDKELDIGTFR